ncbi:MAG: hypothetical protein ACR2IL_05915, partial [Chitinophagaceae bacterium]
FFIGFPAFHGYMVAYSNRGYSGIEGTLFSGGVDVNDGADVSRTCGNCDEDSDERRSQKIK